MASILLGALGSAIAGPVGGMLGGAAGSVLDNLLLNHKHVNKPNFQDLLVEASTMGMPIPPVYGRAKIAGNLIMSSNLNAEKHSSGKGGGGGKSGGGGKGREYYTYNVNCAVGVCRGPVQNIWRIFADSKLIWDMNPQETIVGSGSDQQPFVQSGFLANGAVGGVATLYHYGTGKNSNQQFAGSTVNFYYGTEEQTADPLLQSICEGITGNSAECPAYRGLVYVVFDGFPLGYFGNRIPNFTFEVNGYGLPQNIRTTPSPSPTVGPIDGRIFANPMQNTVWIWNQSGLQIYNMATCDIITNISNLGVQYPAIGDLINGPLFLNTSFSANPYMAGPDNSVWFVVGAKTLSGGSGIIINWDVDAGLLGAYPLASTPTMFGTGQSAYMGSTDKLVVFDINGVYQVYDTTYPFTQVVNGVTESFLHAVTSGSIPSAPTCLCWAEDEQVLVALDAKNSVFHVLSGAEFVPSGPYSISDLPLGGQPYQVIYDQTNGIFIFFTDEDAYGVPKADILNSINPLSTPGITHLNMLADGFGATMNDAGTFQTQQLLQGYWVILAGENVFTVSTATLQTGTNGNWSTSGQVSPGAAWYYPVGGGAVGFTIPDAGGIGLYSNPAGGPVSLEDVVVDICADAGLPSASIDASALAPYALAGYAVTNQASARAALEPLQEAFLFDLIESNFQIIARLRLAQTQNVSITIAETDLGAREASKDPGDRPLPKVIETVKQDFDLPQYVFFRYKTASGNFYVQTFSFEIASQYAKRAASCTGSTAHLSINSPLCLNDATAATIVSNILYLQYINRATVNLKLPIKYLSLDAGDVVDLTFTDTEGNLVSYSVYLQEIGFGADNTLDVQGVSTGTSVFTDLAAVSQVYPGQPLPGAPLNTPVPAPGQSPLPGTIPMASGGPSLLVIAETPPLRDSDNSAGFYWAGTPLNGSSSGWGAVFVQSRDGGQTFATIGSDGSAAAIGTTTTALGSAGRPVPGLWDQENTVTITLIGGGPLAAVTPLQVLNGDNFFLVGSEIIGASDVIQNADGSYTLSTLQRGVKGTDSAIDGHVGGERVVALAADGTVLDYTTDTGAIGLGYLYGLITAGSDITGTRKVDYTMTGARLKPSPPCHLSLQWDSSNNLTITWTPRNRINGEWLDGPEQGTCEGAEGYEIDILGVAGAVRTIGTWQIGVATVGGTAGADTGIRMASYTAAEQQADGLVGAGEAWNPADESGVTLSGANLQAVNSGLSGAAGVRALVGASAGKYYFEIKPTALFNNNTGFGLAASGFTLTHELGSDINGVGARAAGGIYVGGANMAAPFAGIGQGRWIGFAVDLGAALLWVRADPTRPWNGNSAANPTTAVGGVSIAALGGATLYPCFNSQAVAEGALANFGATAFAGAIPSGFSSGFPGPSAPTVTATVYQVNATIGRGFPAAITG